ncbi:MAG: MFS transporter [Kiritimatiellia bacterium]
MPRKIDHTIRALGWTSFFNDWSSEMIFPLLPAFMAEVLGIPKALIGFIDGISQSTASLLKLFSGYLSDRLGRRKALAVTGYVLSNVVKPLLAIAQGWPLVLLVRVSDRIGKGIRTAPRDALIAASADQQRGRAFGFHRAMDTLGAAMGSLSAFLMLRFVPGMPYRLAFLVAVIPGIVGVLCISLGAREPATPSQLRKIQLSWESLPRHLKRLVLAVLVFGLGDYTFTFFLLRTREMGVRAELIPLVYLAHTLVYAGGAYPTGILGDRWSRKPVLMLGFLAYAAMATGFAFLQGALAAWLLMLVFGLHLALTDSTARALVSDLAPEGIRGSALGVYHMGIGIVDLPAGLLAGVLWDQFKSPVPVFLTGASLAILATLVLLSVREPSRAGESTPNARSLPTAT